VLDKGMKANFVFFPDAQSPRRAGKRREWGDISNRRERRRLNSTSTAGGRKDLEEKETDAGAPDSLEH